MPGANHAAPRCRRYSHADLPGLGAMLVNYMNRKQHKRNPTNQYRVARRRKRSERGIALLVCLFVLSIVSVWTVDMLESASVYQSALRNTIEYEQALYQANAGVQHVLAQLEADVNWRGTVPAAAIRPADPIRRPPPTARRLARSMSPRPALPAPRLADVSATILVN